MTHRIIASIAALTILMVSQMGFAQEPPEYNYALVVRAPVDSEETNYVSGLLYLDALSAVRVTATFSKQEGDDENAEGMVLGADGGYMMFLNNERISPYLVGGAGLVLYTGDLGDALDNEVFAYGGLGVFYEVTDGFSLGAEARFDVYVTPDFEFSTATTNLAAVFHF